MTLKCDVCGTEENIAGVASSCLGPISLAFCVECAQRYAEPAWLLAANLDMMDGDPDNLAEWARTIPTFVNGQYITFEEFFEKHYVRQDLDDASTSHCG